MSYTFIRGHAERPTFIISRASSWKPGLPLRGIYSIPRPCYSGVLHGAVRMARLVGQHPSLDPEPVRAGQPWLLPGIFDDALDRAGASFLRVRPFDHLEGSFPGQLIEERLVGGRAKSYDTSGLRFEKRRQDFSMTSSPAWAPATCCSPQAKKLSKFPMCCSWIARSKLSRD